jgi:putative spermidine/putrescine transport system ATP-binding protein
MTAVELSQLTAGYGATPVLQDFSLKAEAGELLALLGPSGCGKTTVLKLIAGLRAPAAGEIAFDGQSILQQPAEQRDVAMVFQKPLLFPYLTVAENVGFGLKMRGLDKGTVRQRVDEALRLVQLTGLAARKPHELSGGQEQRATLARALVIEPRVLLLDEPFSALDENLRAEMRELVRTLHRRLRITTLFVTHDQAEAAGLADRIALLLEGKLEQVGAPREFYLAPQTPRAARFFGWQVLAGAAIGMVLGIGEGSAERQVAFRPESLQLREGGEIEGVIESGVDLGLSVRYRVRLANGEVVELASGPEQRLRHAGESVRLHLPRGAIRYFPNC